MKGGTRCIHVLLIFPAIFSRRTTLVVVVRMRIVYVSSFLVVIIDHVFLDISRFLLPFVVGPAKSSSGGAPSGLLKTGIASSVVMGRPPAIISLVHHRSVASTSSQRPLLVVVVTWISGTGSATTRVMLLMMIVIILFFIKVTTQRGQGHVVGLNTVLKRVVSIS